MPREIVWTKELVLELITIYESHVCLYVTTHPHYINRIKRADAFQAIYETLRHSAPTITLDVIKKKIHTLRNQFIRDMRIIEKSKKSGAGAEDIIEPTLWCYNELLFLKQHCKTRDSISSIEETVTETAENHSENYIPNESMAEDERFVAKRKTKFIATECDKRLKSISRRFDEKASLRSPFDWLCQQVIYEIDQIKDENIRRKTIWKMQRVLRQGVSEDLKKRNPQDFLSPQPKVATTLKPNITLKRSQQDTSQQNIPSNTFQLPISSRTLQQYTPSETSQPATSSRRSHQNTQPKTCQLPTIATSSTSQKYTSATSLTEQELQQYNSAPTFKQYSSSPTSQQRTPSPTPFHYFDWEEQQREYQSTNPEEESYNNVEEVMFIRPASANSDASRSSRFSDVIEEWVESSSD